MRFIYTFKLLSFLIITFLLVSCDPISTYQQVLINQSKEEIVIVRWNKSTGSFPAKIIDSIFIKSFAESVIYKSSRLGGPGSSECNGALVDSIAHYVRNKPALKIEKILTTQLIGHIPKIEEIHGKDILFNVLL